ncbi:MAG: NAD-dependent epimerase/dehydratase family protein [Nevskia sp.]|nr:NAD-dependent epimerase/dehydratase family protein [Nevskia sp.]
MNILAIGAGGFIGRHVVAQLLEAGHRVTVFQRGHYPPPEGAREIRGERDELPQHRRIFAALAPDAVLDVIPYTEAHAQALVESFAGLCPRLVALSSADVYRNYDGLRGYSRHAPDPPPLDEDAPLRERWYPYRGLPGPALPWRDDYEKILVERCLRQAQAPQATVLRLPLVYGLGDRQRRLAPWIVRMLEGRPFLLLGERQARWRWTMGYVENVAAAIALAVTDPRAAGRTYNLGEAQTPTEAERLRRFGAALGWRGELHVLPETRLPPHLRLPLNFEHSLWTDSGRFRSELDFRDPVAEDEALRRTLDWERAHPLSIAPQEYAAEEAAARTSSVVPLVDDVV